MSMGAKRSPARYASDGGQAEGPGHGGVCVPRRRGFGAPRPDSSTASGFCVSRSIPRLAKSSAAALCPSRRARRACSQKILAGNLGQARGGQPHAQRRQGQPRQEVDNVGSARDRCCPRRPAAARVRQHAEDEGEQERVGGDVQIEVDRRMHEQARHGGRQRPDVPGRGVAAPRAAVRAIAVRRQKAARYVHAPSAGARPGTAAGPRHPPRRIRPAVRGNRCARGWDRSGNARIAQHPAVVQVGGRPRAEAGASWNCRSAAAQSRGRSSCPRSNAPMKRRPIWSLFGST